MNSDALSIRKAKIDDLVSLKAIADANRDALGFLLKPKLEEAINENRVLVAAYHELMVGFLIFRHRKLDQQTTLSDICVRSERRRTGIGTKLVDALKAECVGRSRRFIQLKCPTDLAANEFYRCLGFQHVSTEKGHSRSLNIWRFFLFPESC